MNSKYWILIAIVAALLAWAGLETQRLFVARQQLAASLELQKATSQRAALAHFNNARSFAEKK